MRAHVVVCLVVLLCAGALNAQNAQGGRRQRLKETGDPAGEFSRIRTGADLYRADQHGRAFIGEKVDWNDEVRTQPEGLARVVLNDGSILTVSTNSSMHIVQHNAASQQTVLELGYGEMRAQVVKIGQKGGKFEIQTATAVCGVLGTDFTVENTDEFTQVHVKEGRVTMTSRQTGRRTTLREGQVAHMLKADGKVRKGAHPRSREVTQPNQPKFAEEDKPEPKAAAKQEKQAKAKPVRARGRRK